MKQIVFTRPHDEDYTARSLMFDYARENSGKIVYGDHAEALLKLPCGCYRFESWRIDKIAKKPDRITITLTEIED